MLFSSPVKETFMCRLIEGLPDDIALICLSWVPFHLHPKLELVSRSWRAALRSSQLFKTRIDIGSTEDLLCVSAFEPDNLWQLYDPLRDLSITLPVLPSRISHLAHFGSVSTAGKLFVLGGRSEEVDRRTGDQSGSFATNEVWSYDPIIRKWAPCASMLVPRIMFACCELNGKIVVAGGFTTGSKSISQAEMYDPEKDLWVSIQDLPRTDTSACSGVVVEGKLHVVYMGLSTVQVLENVNSGWVVKEYGWVHGPMAVVKGSVYVMNDGVILKQDGDEKKIVALASEFRCRIGLAMIGLRDEIFVIGGVIGPDAQNLGIQTLSDVDVLSVLSEPPVWRQVAPVSRCHGCFFGCTRLTI